MATRKLVERVSARVFCHMEAGGGNPVTIFSSSHVLSPETQEKLAKDCDWESVVISKPSAATEKPSLPQLSFYMPSGEQVSFCAHAAMGASLELSFALEDDDQDDVHFHTAKLLDEEEDDNQPYTATIYDADIVALHMQTIFEESPIPQLPVLYRSVREYCNLEAHHLALMDDRTGVACNASIARPKTLIPVTSQEVLNEITKAPPINSSGFQKACQALGGSTGLYVYAKHEGEDGAWECRQFPRSSGYPEDPATGIAAAALACHLYYSQQTDLPAYKFYQGMAMGKPSLIVVDEMEMRAKGSSVEAMFRLLGRVEVDERDTLEVED